ncbi:MAG: hypothetical protein ACR2MD_14865, partial [Aridibacter sp.]
ERRGGEEKETELGSRIVSKRERKEEKNALLEKREKKWKGKWKRENGKWKIITQKVLDKKIVIQFGNDLIVSSSRFSIFHFPFSIFILYTDK